MEITVSKQQGRVPVTVLQPHGDVDASNYNELINKAREQFGSGAGDFLVDLSDVPFMSSAGLVALHSIAMFLRGEKPVDPQSGWGALKSMDRSAKAACRFISNCSIRIRWLAKRWKRPALPSSSRFSAI